MVQHSPQGQALVVANDEAVPYGNTNSAEQRLQLGASGPACEYYPMPEHLSRAGPVANCDVAIPAVCRPLGTLYYVLATDPGLYFLGEAERSYGVQMFEAPPGGRYVDQFLCGLNFVASDAFTLSFDNLNALYGMRGGEMNLCVIDRVFPVALRDDATARAQRELINGILGNRMFFNRVNQTLIVKHDGGDQFEHKFKDTVSAENTRAFVERLERGSVDFTRNERRYAHCLRA